MTELTGRPAPPAPVTASRLGLPPATAPVMGGVICVVIVSPPNAIAHYGPISLVAMALATVGAVALACMFAVLLQRIAFVALVMSVAFVGYSRNSGGNRCVVGGPFQLAGGVALVGTQVYLSQRGSMTEPAPVPDYK